MPDPQLVTDEAVALILKGDYPAARAAALSLWRRPEDRHRALALLGLLSRLAGAPGRCRPEKTREPEVAAVLLDVLEKCLRHPPGSPEYRRLAGEIMAFLLGLSPTGCRRPVPLPEKKPEPCATCWQISTARPGGSSRECHPVCFALHDRPGRGGLHRLLS